jgi:uncharacterized protein
MLRAVALLALLAIAGPAMARPPVWVVRDADSELLLFGSIHVLPPDMDWRPPRLEVALRQADDLWFELPMDARADAESARLAMAAGALPPDRTLSGLLSPAGAARLSRAAQAYGVPMTLLERLKPWYAEVVLSGAQFLRSGAQASAGVEKTLEASTPPTAARRAFESTVEQIALFDSAPLPEQVKSLETTLEELERTPEAYDTLVAAWLRGDLAAIEAEALTPLRREAPAIYARLVTNRNARWAQALDTRLKGRGRTVVVVGVGHLIGPEGLPARLRALGHRVEGP